MSLLQPVGSFMVPLKHYQTIDENETIYGALKIFKESLHTKDGAWQGERLLVVLKDSEPVGLLTLKSLVKAVGLRLLEEDPSFKANYFSWYFIEQMRSSGRVTVHEVMRPLAQITIAYNSTILKAARVLTEQGINFLPVTVGKKIIGILNSRELFYRYYELTQFKTMHQHRAVKKLAPQKLIYKFAHRLVGG